MSQSPTVETQGSTVSLTYYPRCTFDDGDVVLRSCDGYTFTVHKSLLTKTSPFFRALFEIPFPTADNGCNPIPMEETAQVLDAVLSCVYPMDTIPSISTLEDAFPILRAVDKLEIPRAAQLILREVSSQLEAEPNPLRAWAIAHAFSIGESRRAAAQRYVASTKDFLTCLPIELTWVDGRTAFRLMAAKKAAVKEARAVVQRLLPCARLSAEWERKMTHRSIFSETASSDDLLELCKCGCSWCMDGPTQEQKDAVRTKIKSILFAIDCCERLFYA